MASGDSLPGPPDEPARRERDAEDRIEQLARSAAMPQWLREALALIAQEAANIAPHQDAREAPALIYRH